MILSFGGCKLDDKGQAAHLRRASHATQIERREACMVHAKMSQ